VNAKTLAQHRMKTMLKPKDLASVATKLQVPLIVSDILNGDERLDGDTEYSLHEAISEMQPDSALLCIALCGSKVANMAASSSMRILEIECRKIIEEYALLWLKNAEGNDVDENTALEALSGAAEDLESLAGLLENCLPLLERKNPNAAAVCEILHVQAQAQALVAEAYFEALEEASAAPEIEMPAMSSNVIPFPVQRTQ
jgi:hypothetical protein